MMRCWSCGTEYQGHACPVCSIKREIERGADRIADAQREAADAQRDAADAQRRNAEALQEALAAQAEEQAWRLEAAAAQATRDQRQNIADSFRLQSAANNKRAAELLGAGLLDEALHHAEQAIQFDQGNLDAHLTAAGILWRQGKLESARARFGKAIHVLRTVDYWGRPDWFLAVLRHLPAQEDLYGQFVTTVQLAATDWKYSPALTELVLAMNNAGLKTASIQLSGALISHEPRLELYATLYAVSPETSGDNERGLRTFLNQIKDSRAQLIDQVPALRSSEVLSVSVKDAVLRVVESTYESWSSYIEEQIDAATERAGLNAGNGRREGHEGTGVAVGAVTWLGGTFILGPIVEGALVPLEMWTTGVIASILIFFVVAGILGGAVTTKLLRAWDRDRRVAGARREALDVERRIADELGLNDLPSSVSGGAMVSQPLASGRAEPDVEVVDEPLQSVPGRQLRDSSTRAFEVGQKVGTPWGPGVVSGTRAGKFVVTLQTGASVICDSSAMRIH